jgi:hypothetical protein
MPKERLKLRVADMRKVDLFTGWDRMNSRKFLLL